MASGGSKGGFGKGRLLIRRLSTVMSMGRFDCTRQAHQSLNTSLLNPSDGQVAARDVPRGPVVDVAQEDVGAGLDEDLRRHARNRRPIFLSVDATNIKQGKPRVIFKQHNLCIEDTTT